MALYCIVLYCIYRVFVGLVLYCIIWPIWGFLLLHWLCTGLYCIKDVALWYHVCNSKQVICRLLHFPPPNSSGMTKYSIKEVHVGHNVLTLACIELVTLLCISTIVFLDFSNKVCHLPPCRPGLPSAVLSQTGAFGSGLSPNATVCKCSQKPPHEAGHCRFLDGTF